MRISITTVGTKPRPEISSLITTYTGRLPRDIKLDWIYIKHGAGDPKTSMRQEAEKILKALPKSGSVILLDERGEQLTSEQIAGRFIEPRADITFIIGGAYGVDDSVVKRADYVWSLSKLVMPHQLVRLLLAEQIYRASAIVSGHPYHHP